MVAKAYVLIETAVGRSTDVCERLKRMDRVSAVDVVAGSYDIIAVVEAEDLNSVGDMVTRHIHTVEGITRTVTCMVVSAQSALGKAS